MESEDPDMNKAILPPLIVATGLIAFRGAKNGSAKGNPVPHLPLPSQFIGAFFAFGVLSLASGSAEKPAQLAAWGLDVAILLNLWKPDGTVAQTQTAVKAQATTTNTAST
jgi:hypothetical protein